MNLIKVLALALLTSASGVTLAQQAKAPASCKIYLNEKVVPEVTIADAMAWCELTPPVVQCDDGKLYQLETFKINYLTLKPFQNKDFGIGEGGFPIMAREAVKNGQAGDTIILKEVTYTDAAGNKNTLPIISIKLK